MTAQTKLPDLNRDAVPDNLASSRTNPIDKSDEISVLDLLVTLVERKSSILLITIAFSIGSIGVSLTLPKRYKATVILLPPQQNSSTGAALASQLGGIAALTGSGLGVGIKNPNDMYVAMLKSRTVEDAMVRDFGLLQEYHARYISDAGKAFEGSVTIEGNGKDGLIHITVEDRDPHRAAQLANGYVDEFRSLTQHLAITEASQRRLFFERELEQQKNNLVNAEEALKETEQMTGVIQPDSQSRALIEAAANLRAQIAGKEVQIQGMETYATGENAELVQAQQELQGLRAQLAKLGGSESGQAGEIIVPRGRVPGTSLEYVRKLRDVKYNEALFEILARQFEVAKLDEAKQGALVQVVDSAVPPDHRSSPRRGLIVIGATFLGFVFAISFVFLQKSFSDLTKNPEAAQKLGALRSAASFRSRYEPTSTRR